jgi:hypothetical protein
MDWHVPGVLHYNASMISGCGDGMIILGLSRAGTDHIYI